MIKKALILIMSYSAKIVGVFIIMFFLLTVGMDYKTLFNLPESDTILMIIFIIMLIGVIIGWFRELIGGVWIISGFIVFLVAHLVVSGEMLSGPWFWIFPALGIIYIISSRLRKKYLPDF
jgi:hypothetical protein